MAYQINEDCIGCGTCVDECPVSAIIEEENKYLINPELCTDCGKCAENCPVGAPQLIE